MILQSEVFSHLLVTFVYFFLVSILRLGSGWGIWGMLGMWAGALAGTFFLDIDHLVYWFVTKTEAEDSKEAKRLWGLGDLRVIGKVKGLYGLLKKVHYSHTRLIFHSVVGQIILLVLAFYLLTSGGSIFGSAFIMAVNLHLLKDEWEDFLWGRKEHLADWLFWQIREPKAKQYLREYLVGTSLVFLVLTGLLVKGF